MQCFILKVILIPGFTINILTKVDLSQASIFLFIDLPGEILAPPEKWNFFSFYISTLKILG